MWFLILSGFLSCVNKIEDDPLKPYETLNEKEQFSYMEKVNHHFSYLTHLDNWKEENAKHFHFIDLDQDDDLDLIYDGWSGSEPSCVRIYLNRSEIFEKVFDYGQSVEAVKIYNNQLKYIYVKDPGCCGAYLIHETEFTFNPISDDLKYEMDKQVVYTDQTEVPEKIFVNKKDFKVVQDKYHMRLTPKIDTTDVPFHIGELESNICATYTKGASGKVLAEKADQTGRVWYFVEMDTNAIPIFSVFYDHEQYPTNYRGWMSSRYLEVE
jgi:hypothetical protein